MIDVMMSIICVPQHTTDHDIETGNHMAVVQYSYCTVLEFSNCQHLLLSISFRFCQGWRTDCSGVQIHTTYLNMQMSFIIPHQNLLKYLTIHSLKRFAQITSISTGLVLSLILTIQYSGFTSFT